MDEGSPVSKKSRKDKTKKDKKEKRKRSKATIIKDPNPLDLLADELEKEVDFIRLNKNMSPTCEEESMLPIAVKQREEELDAACTLGKDLSRVILRYMFLLI